MKHLFTTVIHVVRRREVLVPIGFGLGAFFGFLAIQGIQWDEVRAQLVRASPLALAGALALSLLSAYLRAFRWRQLFIGHSISTNRLFMVEMSSLGLNNVSPVRLLDEPTIVTLLAFRDKIPGGLIVATLVMSRIMDMSATLFLAAVVLAAEPTLAGRVIPAVVAGGLFILALVGLLNIGVLERRIPALGRIPGLRRYETAVAALVAHKWTLSLAASLTVGYWLILAPMSYVLARGMGLDLTILQAGIIILGAIFFATATPGLPAALGTFELAVVELASFWGVPRSLAIGYGLVLHVMVFLPPIMVAAFVLPREGIWALGKHPLRQPDTGSIGKSADD